MGGAPNEALETETVVEEVVVPETEELVATIEVDVITEPDPEPVESVEDDAVDPTPEEAVEEPLTPQQAAQRGMVAGSEALAQRKAQELKDRLNPE
jgi:hypothetical protein